MLRASASYLEVTSRLRPSNSEFVLSPENPWRETKRPPLHPLETALILVTGLHLCFLPWALGAMHVWSQLTSLGFAAAGFVLAVLPRSEGKDFSDAPLTYHWPAARLLQSPVFWASLVFLGYIAVQGLNPAWHFLSNEDSWWLEPLDPVSWLPSSVDAPFDRSNPWRELVIFGSLMLLVGSVWLGFTRRKSYHAFLTLLVVNAGLLAMFGLVQRLSGAARIFLSYVPSNDDFVASFIYPNHAGCYLYLMVALSVGLASWHAQRARKRLENSGPAVALVLIAFCCSLLVIFSHSRMSILLLLTFALLIGSSLLLRLFQRRGPTRHRPELFPLVLVLAALFGIGLVTLSTEKTRERFASMIANPATSVLDRTLPRQAASEMFSDHWLYGWGAGCFRYGFAKYTKKYPELHYFSNGTRRYWEHAHNDLLEFPVELGVVGLLPWAFILGYAVRQLYRRRVWRNAVALSLVLGCTLVMLHAWVDFVFQNPAVLLTWGVLLLSAIRWTELDQPSGRQKISLDA